MDIQEITDELQKKLDEEQLKIREQEIVVDELARKYREQTAILKAMKINAQAIAKSISVISMEAKGPTIINSINDMPDEDTRSINCETGDQNYDELYNLISLAAEKAVAKGIIVDTIRTKNGQTSSIRKSIINRAINSIIRSCKGYSYKDYLVSLTKDDLLKLRNAGPKTQEVIKIAQDIIQKENKNDTRNEKT